MQYLAKWTRIVQLCFDKMSDFLSDGSSEYKEILELNEHFEDFFRDYPIGISLLQIRNDCRVSTLYNQIFI